MNSPSFKRGTFPTAVDLAKETEEDDDILDKQPKPLQVTKGNRASGNPLIEKETTNTFSVVQPITSGFTVQTLSKLPHTVNIMNLRESLLSDAPFVNKKNKEFWRKWIENKSFGQIFSAIFHVISLSIGDNGTVYVDSFYNLYACQVSAALFRV